MDEQITLKSNVPDVFETEDSLVLALSQIDKIKVLVKLEEKRIEQAAIDYMKAKNISKIVIDDAFSVMLGKKKTDRFESDYIKAQLGFTSEQLEVLPKNPAWKKSAVLANDKISCSHSIEEKDEITVKIVDTTFIKGK